MDDRSFLAARARQHRDRSLCLSHNAWPTCDRACEQLGFSPSDRVYVVATDIMEAAAVLHRSPRPAVRRDRSCLLDGGDGQVRRHPVAGGFRKQYRIATLLLVRPDRLCPRSPHWDIVDPGNLRALLGSGWRTSDTQPMARPLQRPGGVAVDLFLSS